MGPQGYKNHQYYVFGGVADLNPTAYLTSICNLPRVQNDKPVQFETTDDFLMDWADARKLAYSQCAGWIMNMAREWYKLKTRSLRSHADVGSAIGLILKVFASGL
ncbi:hypothetical protein B0H14DRAFT_2700330 [Mycena olivaceomarginata]|nr:hypothetical protein B0H14DRAFT_2700330 [Mycena olivaceomarginata]